VTENDPSRIISANEAGLTLGKKVLQGSILQFFSRFLFRGIKFIRTLVIAQLLFPGDVGLFALSNLCLGFIDTFVQSGFQGALVQRSEVTKNHLDGSWSVHVIKGVFLAGVYFLSAPIMADFFNEPRLEDVIRVMSLIMVFDGFASMGTVMLQRNLQFGRKLVYDLSYTIVEVVTVICVAFFIPNVWALVAGALASHFAILVFSYVVHPYRPHFTFDFSGARELFRFGKWMWLGAIVTFFVSRGDGLVVSKFISTEALGYYQFALSLALLPALEVVRSAGSVFFPMFSRLKDSPDRFIEIFMKTTRIIVLLVAPMSVGLYVLDEQIVNLLYGERWLPMVPVLEILILYGIFKSVEYLLTPILHGAGHPKITTVSMIIQGIVLACTIVPLTKLNGIEGVASSLLFSVIVSSLFLGLTFMKSFKIRMVTLYSVLVVPVIATAGLYIASISYMLAFSVKTMPGLVCITVYGVIVYAGLVFLCDRITGKYVYESISWMSKNVR